MTNMSDNLKIFLENFPGNNYYKDTNSVYLGCNNNMAQLAMLDSPSEIVGKTDADLPWSKLANELFLFEKQVIQQDKEMAIEFDLNLVDGSVAVYLVIGKPYKNKDGEIIGVLGILTDVTRQKVDGVKEEQQQLVLNTYLESTLNSLPEAIYWVDKNGILLGCNDVEANIFGFETAEKLFGKTMYYVAELLGWDKKVADTLRENDKEVVSTGKAKTVEETVFSLDGKVRIFLSHKAPFYNKSKNIIGFIGTSIDITERKEIERLLKISKEQAEAASKAKTEFLANMTHDIRTPLISIIGLSKLLTYNLTGQNLNFAQNLLGASQELLKFFNSCIELSKIEYEGVPTTLAIFNLKSVLDEISALFQPAVREKNINLSIRSDEKIPISLIGNRTNIYRILLNLTGNAIKFTQQGSITISAELSEESTTQQAIVKLTVADTGIGIPKDKQNRIFERFTRLTSSHEGYGIGLYVVKKFVDAMGGSIQVNSKEREGSKFTVILPLHIECDKNDNS